MYQQHQSHGIDAMIAVFKCTLNNQSNKVFMPYLIMPLLCTEDWASILYV